MPKPDPHFSHLSQDAREEVFKHFNKALNELATYIPSARQNPDGKVALSTALAEVGALGIHEWVVG